MSIDSARGPSRLANLGGGATLAAGAAFVLLLLALFGAILAGLARQNDAAQVAEGTLRMATHVRLLLQGINETVVTDGAAASKATVVEAIRRVNEDRKQVSIDTALVSARMDWDRYAERARAFLALRDLSNDNVEGMIEVGRLTSEGGRLAAELDKSADSSRAAYASAQLTLRWLIGLAALAGLVGTAGIFFMFYRRVTQPLRRAIGIAERIAGGDLSGEIDTHRAGETLGLVNALRRMQGSLATLVQDVRDGTLMVSTAAGQVSAASMDLSSRTETQASTLEETASS
ncbi:MAG: HAMP domain-containing protein, partial [Betaproteobacteria bacterium]|nr:HAMP domain-containing protein [Betaproteobacteria bacterium]